MNIYIIQKIDRKLDKSSMPYRHIFHIELENVTTGKTHYVSKSYTEKVTNDTALHDIALENLSEFRILKTYARY